MTEKDLVLQIAQYLQLQYPNLIYRWDLAADMKLTIGQASRNKALHPRRGHPDLFIAQPVDDYAGLFLEVKAVDIYKKDGTLKKNEHLAEQEAYMERLRNIGYWAQFVSGFDEAKQAVDNYLK